jgi:hypothetical protein
MQAIPRATDEDMQRFRRILSQQKTSHQASQDNLLKKILVKINRAMGRPWRLRWSIHSAIEAAVLGTQRSGSAVSKRYGISIITQFLQLFAVALRSSIYFNEYYLYQLYLPERWRSRIR